MAQRQKKNTIFNKVTSSIFEKLTSEEKESILNKYLTKELIKVFEDEDLSFSVDCFLKNNLNVSETSRDSFMHRNTLLYRLAKIKRVTNLNVRNFEDAVVFRLIQIIYKEVYRR